MSLGFLESLGLSKKEADMYDLLLRVGEVPAATIIEKMHLKRATAYKTLYELESKGLVSKQDKNKIIHFKPEPPSSLLRYAEDQVQSLQRVREDIRALVPQLTSSYILSVEKPVVTTFQGVEGLKEIYLDTLREKKDIYAFLQTGEVEPALFKWLTTDFVKKRTRLKIHAYSIVSSGKWAQEYKRNDKNEERTTLLVPQDKFPFQHEAFIYGNKVAFIDFKKGESLIGIVITHPQIAITMKALFDLAWIGAEKYNEEH